MIGSHTNTLTPRETEVVQLLACGCTMPEVAATLWITPATVKSHTEHARAKMGAKTTTALVASAFRAGLIE